MEQMSSKINTFVPYIGTKVYKRVNFVQYEMILRRKERILKILRSYKLFGIEYIDPIDLNNIHNIDHRLPTSIDDLYDHIDHCSLCTLSHNRSFRSLYNKDSSIVVVTKNDNLYQDNKLFDSFKTILSHILNKDINSFYFTALLKCGIDNSKVDLELSLNSCIDYFEQEIVIIKPKIILAIDGAFDYIQSRYNLKERSSGMVVFNRYKIVRVDDPIHIQKNPSLKVVLENELKKIKLILERR